MLCITCNNPLRHCVCPDKKERIAKILDSKFVLVLFCRNCNTNQYECTCPDPKYYDPQGRISEEELQKRRYISR